MLVSHPVSGEQQSPQIIRSQHQVFVGQSVRCARPGASRGSVIVSNRGPIVEGYQYLASCCTMFTGIIARHITTARHFPNRAEVVYSETRHLINLGPKLVRSEQQVLTPGGGRSTTLQPGRQKHGFRVQSPKSKQWVRPSYIVCPHRMECLTAGQGAAESSRKRYKGGSTRVLAPTQLTWERYEEGTRRVVPTMKYSQKRYKRTERLTWEWVYTFRRLFVKACGRLWLWLLVCPAMGYWHAEKAVRSEGGLHGQREKGTAKFQGSKRCGTRGQAIQVLYAVRTGVFAEAGRGRATVPPPKPDH